MGNGNFWAALFIPLSGYNPSLPSPLSGGKFKARLVLMGLAGGAGSGGHRVGMEGGSAGTWSRGTAHPSPRYPEVLAGASSSLQGFGGAVFAWLSAGMCQGFPVLGKRSGQGSVAGT